MSRDEQVEARARELVMAAYAEAGMQPQPWFLHDDPASFRGSDYFLFKAIIEALRGASGGGVEETDCETCRGNGEIVLDWDVYLHPPKDAPADAGVADCPDCDGTGKVDAPDHPAENAKSSGDMRAGSGVAAIAAERRRQVEQEGWTPEHDDEHSGSEMAAAAAAYAFSAATYERYFAADPMGFWPWDASWWKPKGPREDLVRAGALIAAEIDRLDRAALARSGTGEG